MRHLFFAATAFYLVSCVSFPRAERDARRRMEETQQKSSDEAANGGGLSAPPVGKREGFQDPYFRG